MNASRRIAPFVIAFAWISAPSAAAPEDPVPGVEGYTVAGDRVPPLVFDGDMRTLPLASPATAARTRVYFPLRRIGDSQRLPAAMPKPETRAAAVPIAPMPAASQNFAGMSFNDACTGGSCGSGWPPDTNGDVGPNHYIQAVNQAFGIFSKTGTRLAAFTDDQLWSAAGASPCNGNSQGDPIVLYDALADRWILTQFAFAVVGGQPASPFYQCIAVSKSGDPVAGGWYFYPLRMDSGSAGHPPVGTLNDYSKFGIWNDCLYMSANEFKFPAGTFAGTLYASFSRTNMYAGAPLTWSLGFIGNTTGPFTMLPSNASGKAGSAIPPGTANYFVSESTTDFAFEVRKFVAGPNCGSGGFLTLPVIVDQAAYNFNLPNAPQPNTSNTLDTTGDRLMQKAQYRKVGSKESLWVVHTTQTPSGKLAPQWAQIDVTGGVIDDTPVQQQIYAPDNVLHRWMGSLAVDGQGNMALGYSTSGASSPNFPSIAYAGRLAADPQNQLPQAEVKLVAGNGSQTNNCGGAPCDRWGDYSAMSVDPTDDCTFWYTNQYYSSQANGTSGNWQTRIGAFRFATCAAAPPSTTVVSSSGNPSFAAASVTYTATVTGTAPTGTVRFDDGGVTIGGCAAVALSGAGNTRTATCASGALAAGNHVIDAMYSGNGANAASQGMLAQLVVPRVPGTANVSHNPYGPLSVTGATLNGITISNFQQNVVIQLGNIPGELPPPVLNFALLTFQGINLGPGTTLTIRSGAADQKVFIDNWGNTASAIAGALVAEGANGAPPPVLYFRNFYGVYVQAGGSIKGPRGVGIDALVNWGPGNAIFNAGIIDGGTGLELVGTKINGGGQFRGNLIIVRTLGNANNPVNGAYFLQNGLQLYPGSGNDIAVTLHAFGGTPQVINLVANGNATLSMPSAWPPGSTVPANNAVVAPGSVRAAGVPDPAYGGGSMIFQATGALTLVHGGTNDFVFPGAIVLKAGGPLDLNGVVVDQAWTTSGRTFQGIFFESPSISSSNGNIQTYGNDLNWVNFSTFPLTPVRAFTLVRNGNGTASFVAADATAPHLNTYSVLVNAAADGQCWTCLTNMQPVNMYGP
jgi:hypothetical protein